MRPKLSYHDRYTTFDIPAGCSFNRSRYDSDIKALEGLPVWRGTPTGLSLWRNQKEAIALSAAYLRVVQQPGQEQAALIKMPTGSGKSGVIAVLTRCLPDVRRALVLTPREGLVQQMHGDIRRRFWANMGCTAPGTDDWTGLGVDPALIRVLLPNDARTELICREAKAHDRVILVGTLQALDRMRIDRDKLKRKALVGPLDDALSSELARLERIFALLATFDLIVVDEGHYEPAPSWSRSVRSLARPTLLLSATPFRAITVAF